MKLKLTPVFFLTVLAVAAFAPLTFGASIETLAVSAFVVVGSTVLLDGTPSLNFGGLSLLRAQLGEVGEGSTKELLQKLKQLDEDWKKHWDQRAEDVKQHGQVLSATQEKLTKIEQEMDRLEDIAKRLDDIEAKDDAPVLEQKGITKKDAEHIQAWESWFRDPTNHEKKQALKEAAEAANPRLKAVSTTTDASGGYAVPEIIARRITEKVQSISPMRGLVDFVTVGSSDYKELVDVNGEGYGWAGETDTRNETNTGRLEQVIPTMGTLYAYPKATEESLDDIFFNVEQWLIRKVSLAFAKGEGAAIISGNGTNKPTGILAGTPQAKDDEGVSPERPFGTLQYLPTGVADGFGHNLFNASPAGARSGGDVFIDAEYALKPEYRQNAVWLVNKSTLKVMRKWKDADGNYLWQRSLVAGQPSTFMGYPVIEMPDMPDVAANAFPVAFGDFRQGYLGVDRVGVRMTVDNVTTPGYVKYYVRRRVGGKLLNDDAIKLIKCATT